MRLVLMKAMSSIRYYRNCWFTSMKPTAVVVETSRDRAKEKDHAAYAAQPSFSNTFATPIIGGY